MICKRKDSKGRNLRSGEFQDKDGRYRFTYYAKGKQKCVYSWKLEETDQLPRGKRPDKALRTKIKEIKLEQGLGLDIIGGFSTVEMVVQRFYLIQKKNPNIKPRTITAYETAMKHMSETSFYNRRINTIVQSDAIEYVQNLQVERGWGFSTIKNIHGLFKSAFDLAMNDKLLRLNPFAFSVAAHIEDDTKKRIALEKVEKEKLLLFIKNDPYYKKYSDVIEFLFETGLRISEFCGLTTDDIDFEKRFIHIRKQLYREGGSYEIVAPKTDKSKRKIPLSDKAFECLQNIVNKRSEKEKKVKVLGYSGFLTFNRNGNPCCGMEYAHRFSNIWKKYKEKNYVEPEYTFTPHVCRHTYATEMVSLGMDIKILSELLGHANVQITYDTYVHMTATQKEDELVKLGIRKK